MVALCEAKRLVALTTAIIINPCLHLEKIIALSRLIFFSQIDSLLFVQLIHFY